MSTNTAPVISIESKGDQVTIIASNGDERLTLTEISNDRFQELGDKETLLPAFSKAVDALVQGHAFPPRYDATRGNVGNSAQAFANDIARDANDQIMFKFSNLCLA